MLEGCSSVCGWPLVVETLLQLDDWSTGAVATRRWRWRSEGRGRGGGGRRGRRGRGGREGERKEKIGSRVRDRMKRRKGMGETHRKVQRKGQKVTSFQFTGPSVAHTCPGHCHILQCSLLTDSTFTV